MPPPRSRKKTQAVPRRRVAVQDDDGWTHITNTRRVATTARTTAADTMTATTDQLIPAEIPDGLTLSQLRAQFDAHQEKWLASQTWKAITASPIAITSNTSNTTTTSTNNHTRIDKFICIGLGSPSGFLRSGLVDRRAVSLFQLAAFISLIDLLSPNTRTTTRTTESNEPATGTGTGTGTGTTNSERACRCYAQDPVFNRLDVELLASLGVEVVRREAFGMVDEQTVVFGPGMERRHLVEVLARRPVVFFGGPLGVSTSTDEVLEEYSKNPSVRLPEFEPNTAPFWGTSVFWRSSNMT
ncbi:SRR1 domain-containing protein [Trichophyton interdigitale]|nr:SRR1 domain-containing protein [Trichophyton interdigitale]